MKHMIDTTYLDRCIRTLERAFANLQKSPKEDIDYDMYRSACVKEFEIILEMSAKLLRKVLKPYFHTTRAVDELTWKDVFRHVVLRSMLTGEEAERWFEYRDARNATAHDYGANLAEETLFLIPAFLKDAANLAAMIQSQNPEADAPA